MNPEVQPLSPLLVPMPDVEHRAADVRPASPSISAASCEAAAPDQEREPEGRGGGVRHMLEVRARAAGLTLLE